MSLAQLLCSFTYSMIWASKPPGTVREDSHRSLRGRTVTGHRERGQSEDTEREDIHRLLRGRTVRRHCVSLYLEFSLWKHSASKRHRDTPISLRSYCFRVFQYLPMTVSASWCLKSIFATMGFIMSKINDPPKKYPLIMSDGDISPKQPHPSGRIILRWMLYTISQSCL